LKLRLLINVWGFVKAKVETHFKKNGGIAQLGERLHGMQEVSGSIPLTSTKMSFSTAQFEREHRFQVPFV
jgi:hypothetical protein